MEWRQLRRWVSVAGLLLALMIAGGWPHVVRHARAQTPPVIPEITLSPTSGPPGTTITITPVPGTTAPPDLPAGSQITPNYLNTCNPNATLVPGAQSYPVTADGAIPTMTITIPASEPPCNAAQDNGEDVLILALYSPTNEILGPAGFDLIGNGTVVGSPTATGTVLAFGSPTATFVPGAPQISVTPSGALAPGSSFTISGSNFPSNTSVTLILVGNGVTIPLTPGPVASASGTFSGSFIAPAAAGAYTLIATAGSAGAQSLIVVSQNVTTTPTAGAQLAVSPAVAIPGQSVTITGSGFAPNGQVTISSSLGGTPMVATANINGAIGASYLVPSNATGSTIVLTAVDASGHSATAYISLNTGQATLSVSPNVAFPGQALAVTGANFAAGEQVTLGLALPTAPTTLLNGTTQTVTVSTSRALSASYPVPSVAGGSYLLVAIGQSSNLTASAPLTIQDGPTATATSATVPFPSSTPAPYIPPTATATATATPAPPTATPTPPVATQTTYFAEGYTGRSVTNGRANFDESLYLFNAANAATSATVSYYIVTGSSGATRVVLRTVRLPAYGTSTLSVNADAGNDNLVSIAVGHAPGVVARVVVHRTNPKGAALDAAASTGSPREATSWSFAEGYTGVTFQEYLSIFNPGSAPAHALVHFLPTSGTPPAPLSVTVPAAGRQSLNIGALYLQRAGPHAPKSIALIVTSDQPIVADRTLYWGEGAGSGKYGYDIVPGAPSGVTGAIFAALPLTGANEPYITVLNPNSARASLQIVFRDASGHVLVSYTGSVGPLARLTVPVRSVVSKYSGVLSATLNATAPVVAEAPIYFGGSPNVGGHPGISLLGAAPAAIAALAGAESNNGTLYIYNPGGSTLHVTGLIGTATGSAGQGTLDVPPLSVLSASLPPGTVPRGLLLTAGGPFVAELINGADRPAAWGGTIPLP